MKSKWNYFVISSAKVPHHLSCAEKEGKGLLSVDNELFADVAVGSPCPVIENGQLEKRRSGSSYKSTRAVDKDLGRSAYAHEHFAETTGVIIDYEVWCIVGYAKLTFTSAAVPEVMLCESVLYGILHQPTFSNERMSSGLVHQSKSG